MTRGQARLKIVQAANRQRLRNPARRALPLYTLRHLQRCVAVCRANGLVRPDVLTAAGFNVHGPRRRTGRSAA